MNELKFVNLLSMAQRAGKVLSGDFAVAKELEERKKRVRLVVLAADAADETAERYKGLAEKSNIDIRQISLDKESLGHCIGKEYRAVAAVIDNGFAKALLRLIEEDA